MLPKDTDKREFSARVTWHCKNISAQNTVKFATFFRETWVVGRRKLLWPGSMGSTLRSNCQKKVSCLSDTSAPYHEVYLQAYSYSRISLAAVFPHQIYTTIKGRVGERGNLFYSPILFPHRLRWCLQRFCLNCYPKHILDLFLHWTDVLFPKTHTAVWPSRS